MDTIVIISSVPWHFSWQRHHDIACGLAERGFKTIYVDPLPKRIPRLSEWKRALGRLFGSSKLGGKFAQDLPGKVDIIAPLALPDIGVFFPRVNALFFMPLLARKIKRMGAGACVVMNYLPTASSLRLQRLLDPKVCVYDCTEDWENFPTAQSTRVLEKEMIRAADLVFATAPYLLEKIKTVRAKNVHLVLPGAHYADFEVCRQFKKDENDASIRCAYFGGLRGDTDLDLLRAVSQSFQLRLIGPLEAGDLDGFSKATEFVGPVTYQALPAFLADVDVLLLPYLSALPHVRGIMPAKTFQCLATGKPTVVSGLESLREFEDFFYLADAREDFIAHIRRAAREDDGQKRARRLELARANDWRVRLDFIVTRIKAGLEK